jgi:uncharacterized protein (DUF1499 family)
MAASSLVIGTPARNYNAHSAPMSLWTVRLGLFSVALIFVGMLGHRLFSMPTLIALNLFKAGFAGAAVTFLVGGLALYQIWRRGGRGAVTTVMGLSVALGIFAWPLSLLPSYRGLPRINDVSTDMQAPPKFVSLAKTRTTGSNNPAYPGLSASRQQSEAYPDIKPFILDRSAEEAFDIVIAALNRNLKMKIMAEDPPKGRYGNPGFVEAIDRTLVLGFTDDIVIRVDGDANSAKIDVRSASRYGQHDLGRNAQRVRKILKEIQWMVEATIPAANGERVGRLKSRGRVVVPRRLKDGATADGKPGQKPAAAAAKPAATPAKPAAPAEAKDKQPVKAKRRNQEKFE